MLKNIFKNIVSHSPNSNLRSNLLTYVSILSKQFKTMTCATFHSFLPNKMFRSGRDWTNLCFIFIFFFTKLLQHFRVPNIRSLTHTHTQPSTLLQWTSSQNGTIPFSDQGKIVTQKEKHAQTQPHKVYLLQNFVPSSARWR